jgi:hypothetical protein
MVKSIGYFRIVGEVVGERTVSLGFLILILITKNETWY